MQTTKHTYNLNLRLKFSYFFLIKKFYDRTCIIFFEKVHRSMRNRCVHMCMIDPTLYRSILCNMQQTSCASVCNFKTLCVITVFEVISLDFRLKYYFYNPSGCIRLFFDWLWDSLCPWQSLLPMLLCPKNVTTKVSYSYYRKKGTLRYFLTDCEINPFLR